MRFLMFDFGLNKKKTVQGELKDYKVQPTNVILQRETKWSDFFNLGSSSEGTISFNSNFVSD